MKERQEEFILYILQKSPLRQIETNDKIKLATNIMKNSAL